MSGRVHKREERISAVATHGERDAVTEGLVKGSDEAALSATKRAGRAARADRARVRYDVGRDVLASDMDGDGDRDLGDEALEVMEDRLREAYYGRHRAEARAKSRPGQGPAAPDGASAQGAPAGHATPDGATGRAALGQESQAPSAAAPRPAREIISGREGAPVRRGPASARRARHLARRRRAGTPTLKARQRKANLAQALREQRAEQLSGPAARAANAARRSSSKGAAAAIGSVLPPLAGAVSAILAFVLAALVVGALMGSIFGFWKHEDDKQRLVAGLPPYITYEMVVTALEMQEQYGHPAGCTLAQIILESGVGDHLSGLAARDNNLFGIKWGSGFASCPEVTGYESWVTKEEYDGQIVTITDRFCCFASHKDCIVFRSRVFLQLAHYRDNPTIQRAMAEKDSDLMAQGLKESGYATSSEYVSSLKSVMDLYGLRRFDSMDKDAFDAEMAGGVTGTLLDGDATPRQQAVVNAAFAETYCVPKYCAEYVMRVYERAGISRANGGDARDIFWRWCTSSDLSTLKPGMVIAVPTHAGTSAGRIWGHVAVYVGGGMVRDNVGYLRMTPVNDWIAYYSSITSPKWGWYGGIALA